MVLSACRKRSSLCVERFSGTYRLNDMEATSARDEIIRIATEGLRLAQDCKMPRFCSSAGSDQLVQQQHDVWSKRLTYTVPPLLDWIEQHRQPLFGEEWDLVPVVLQEFQKRFVLVYMEQRSGYVKNRESQWDKRLYKFSGEVVRIVTKNAVLRSWLFHYYGSELGLQGWQSRPGDLYGLYQLVQTLSNRALDKLFGQQMVSFLEHLAKELLGFQPNMEYQTIGVLVMGVVMENTYGKESFTKDAEEILRMVLHLSRRLWSGPGDELWVIVYFTVSSTRGANSPNSALDDEIMLNMLAHMDEELMKKQDDPTYIFNDAMLVYLRTVTLLLLLDVPDVDLKDFHFDDLTISRRLCDRDKFRRHVKLHTRTKTNLRFSVHIRLRIANMIPKLFTGFTSDYYVDRHAYHCVELLAWLTMFPVSQTRQQKTARAMMLHRLLRGISRLCEHFIRNPFSYAYDYDDLDEMYICLHPMVTAIQDGLKQLPNTGWFGRFKSTMQVHTAAVLFMVELLKGITLRF